VLYRTLLGFTVHPLTAGSFFLAIFQFSLIFVGSCFVGVTVALLSALFFKWTFIAKYSFLETAILVLFAYSSYLAAEAVNMSGIVSVLFCGICMSQYAFSNLSDASQSLSVDVFSILALLTETLVFVYLGLALFTFTANVDPGFIIMGIIIILIARAANVYPLSYLVNASRPADRRITKSYQFFMWFAGLRGAIAFVLSLDVPTPHGPEMRTTTIAIIFFTVLVEGGMTVPLLEKLGIPIHVPDDAPDASDEGYGKMNVKFQSWFHQVDAKWFRPFFVRQRSETEYLEMQEQEEHHAHGLEALKGLVRRPHTASTAAALHHAENGNASDTNNNNSHINESATSVNDGGGHYEEQQFGSSERPKDFTPVTLS